jgi:hypothetical protein
LKRKYKHLIGIRCSAHVLNLLIEDFCKLKTIHDHIIITKSIIKEITRSSVKLGIYKEEWSKYSEEMKRKGRVVNEVSLCLPAETRWYSIRNMLRNIIHARPVLLRMAIDKDIDLTLNVRQEIKNDDFWDKAEKIYALITPIVEGK